MGDALQKALQAACQITNHELIQKITKALAALWKTHRASSTTQMGRSVEFLQLAVEKTADNPEASIAALSEMAAYRRQLAASKDDAEALKAILKWKTCAE